MTTNLIIGDALSCLADIEGDSVDAVICDPPYGTTACSWDSVVPLTKLFKQLRRVTKKEGVIVMTATQPFTSALIMSNIKDFRYCWVWEKEQGVNFMMAKKQPLKVHEDIVVFSQKRPPYYPQMTTGEPYVRSATGNSGDVTGNVEKTVIKNNGTRYPRSIIRYKRERGLHPTQKPVGLMEYLIKTYTHPGEVVLDPFMGSGTTGVAAVRNGRCFIGIELYSKFFEIAKKRLEDI